MRKIVRASLLLVIVAASVSKGETISAVSVRKLDRAATGVAWLDSEHLVVAGPAGVQTLSLRDGVWADLIPLTPVPHGLPDPLSVTTDGKSVVASNGFERSQFACRADNKKRIFARESPDFMVIDLAVSGDKLYVLGWPVDTNGANNAEGVAVWRGGLNSRFEKLEPLHRLQSGPASVAIFNDSLPTYGGALAIEANGTLDVITAAESGIFQYAGDGVLQHRLGTALGELVMRRMHDINFTYGSDPIGRYRHVVNTQPTIDDLIETPDGPAIVVRIAREGLIEWELWYPNDTRIDRRVKLGISRQGPFGHLACDARNADLVCVYQTPATVAQAVDIAQNNLPATLVQFKLPKRRGGANARVAAAK